MRTIRLRIADCGLRIYAGISRLILRSQNLFLVQSKLKNPQSAICNPQSGAALVALLAAMSLMAIVLLAAAPNYYQQIQREKELEQIRRGEEVATAIRAFIYYEKRLPKSMEELLEGVDVPGRTKKLMVLRASAAKDPLSSTGEWKLVQSNDEVLKKFSRKLFLYNNNNPLTNPGPQEVRQILDPFTTRAIVNNLDVETSEESEPPGGEDTSGDSDVPFIGVVSRRQTKSVLTYYGIERHDWWVYTPLYRGEGGFGIGNPNNQPRPQPTR
jgi:type II secretory pathway pseudopilin PulG